MLIYWAEVEKQHDAASHQLGQSHAPSIPASSADATAPAEERDFASTGGSSVAGKMDNRRSGFIEQSRSNSMHPRRLVNSSISLITKPFIHTTGGGGEDDGAAAGNALQALGRRVSSPPNLKATESQPLGGHLLQGKAGSLIIQRSVKFRGRNWYRKWFVLDPRKCVLRYYDSETAARRGLSLAKLNLTNKHASLAITSSLSLDAAPTPYMFLIRTRKRCWKVCAPSQSEYNEWENAISTAILAAQLSRRGRSSKKAMRKAARSAATLKDSHAGGSSEEAASVSGYTATGSSLATTNSSLAHGEGLRPIEESDDDDDEFEAKEDDESDDDDSDSDSDSDDEPHGSESDVVEAVSGATRPYAIVDTTALANVRLPDLKKLPVEWKLGFVAVLNVVLLSVRSAPAVVIVLVLFVVDWYLLLKYMKRSWCSEKDVTPSSSTKAKAE
ncbi:hypothetical protein BBJ28_00006549 [Nothophytophthora sp. Chile5]|nr:hypothetical protein BBJ28_00006549 [Nothophytophthora sp. Chile5]